MGRGKALTQNPGWTLTQIAAILSVRPQTIGRWRDGVTYPDVPGLKKIEAIFGWPAREQIDLIPLADKDIRWSLVFNRVLREWMDANPRTLAEDELVPLVRARKPGGGRKKKV